MQLLRISGRYESEVFGVILGDRRELSGRARREVVVVGVLGRRPDQRVPGRRRDGAQSIKLHFDPRHRTLGALFGRVGALRNDEMNTRWLWRQVDEVDAAVFPRRTKHSAGAATRGAVVACVGLEIAEASLVVVRSVRVPTRVCQHSVDDFDREVAHWFQRLSATACGHQREPCENSLGLDLRAARRHLQPDSTWTDRDRSRRGLLRRARSRGVGATRGKVINHIGRMRAGKCGEGEAYLAVRIRHAGEGFPVRFDCALRHLAKSGHQVSEVWGPLGSQRGFQPDRDSAHRLARSGRDLGNESIERVTRVDLVFRTRERER